MPAVVIEGASETRVRHEVPVLTSLGLRAAAAADLSASLARLLGPLLDVLIRLWLAEDFLVTDVMQHMLHDVGYAVAPDHLPLSASLLAGLAATGFGVFVQTICPALLAAGLFTRFAALALLVQVLVLQIPGHAQLAPYSVALLGWIIVLGPGPLSLDGIFRPGLGAAALPLVGLAGRGLAALTERLGPAYALLLRLWIATGLAAIALGGVKGLSNMLPTGMAMPMVMTWLPHMSGMTTGLASWALLALAVLLALGLLTRAVALLLIVLIPTGMLAWGGHFGWVTLLNLPLLGLPLLYGAGQISLDHAIAASFRRRFPPFEALPAAAASRLPHVVVVGGGFGGVAAAHGLRYAPCRVTLLDQHNYHLFQPLLYQVATASMSPADIATPLREMFRAQANLRVLLGEVTGVDPALRQIALGDTRLAYDFLIIATGARHSYFGHDDWAPAAPGLKGIGDALDICRRLLLAFEAAERSRDEAERQAWLTFVIVGGGPTGVELAGAIAELARHGLTREFRTFDPASARIVLVQSTDRVLPTFPPSLSAAAARSLATLGVEVLTGRRVKAVDAGGADVGGEWIAARTVVWAAGVAASPAAAWLGVAADPAGRVPVGPDLRVPGRPEIFVIGDTAACNAWRGKPTPALAPAAKQGGAYAARAIRAALAGRPVPPPFRYRHYGSLATIGRQAAVADFGVIQVRGAPAWWLWGAAHIAFLVGVRNRIIVLVTWFWAYLTFRRSSRLITGSGL
ncbi:MAG TPA: NAD(P)/FAD-dependent oxidoreductase [Stellaceae bacterium]|jgi:NADH dehydrogenase/putative oxidoreductase